MADAARHRRAGEGIRGRAPAWRLCPRSLHERPPGGRAARHSRERDRPRGSRTEVARAGDFSVIRDLGRTTGSAAPFTKRRRWPNYYDPRAARGPHRRTRRDHRADHHERGPEKPTRIGTAGRLRTKDGSLAAPSRAHARDHAAASSCCSRPHEDARRRDQPVSRLLERNVRRQPDRDPRPLTVVALADRGDQVLAEGAVEIVFRRESPVAARRGIVNRRRPRIDDALPLRVHVEPDRRVSENAATTTPRGSRRRRG